MSEHLLIFASYVLALAYVSGRLWDLLSIAVRSMQNWLRSHKASGRIISLMLVKDRNIPGDLPLSFAGWMIGLITMGNAHRWTDLERVLLLLLICALSLEELRLPRRRSNLLEVIFLMSKFRTESASRIDIISILKDCLPYLPRGDISAAIEKTVNLSHRGYPIENCLASLRKANPFLEEFVLILEHTGWRTGHALDLALELLSKRAAHKWDRISKTLQFKMQVQPFVVLGRGVVLSGMLVILVLKFPLSFNIEGAMLFPWWLIPGILGTLLVFRHLFISRMLRLATLAGLFALGVIVGFNPLPTELNQSPKNYEITHMPTQIVEDLPDENTLLGKGSLQPFGLPIYSFINTKDSTEYRTCISKDNSINLNEENLKFPQNSLPFQIDLPTNSIGEGTWYLEIYRPK
jgi:hypothetical protein